MSDYTKLNLREVEDQAPRFGFAPNLQARFAKQALDAEQTGMSLQRLAPNYRVPFGHLHREQEEIYVVIEGSGRVKIGEEVVEVGPLDAVRVAPGAMRAFEAGPEGIEYVAFGAPSTGSPGADTEMEQGWWE